MHHAQKRTRPKDPFGATATERHNLEAVNQLMAVNQISNGYSFPDDRKKDINFNVTKKQIKFKYTRR